MALRYMYGKEFIRRLLSGERDFSKIRLEEGFNFDTSSFTHNLREYLLSQDFSKYPISLCGSDLSHIKLYNYNFAFTQGKGADFTGASLIASNFQEAHLEESSFLEADLRDVNFKEANLYHADLRASKLHNVNFSHTCLSGTDLREAILNTASFDRTDLRGTDLRGVSGLEDCNSVRTAKFKYTKVTEREKAIIDRLLESDTAFTLMSK